MAKQPTLAVLDVAAFQQNVVSALQLGETDPLVDSAVRALNSRRGAASPPRRFQGLGAVMRRIYDQTTGVCQPFERAETIDPSIEEPWRREDLWDLVERLIIEHALRLGVRLPKSAGSLSLLFRPDVFGLAPERFADPRDLRRATLLAPRPPRPEELGLSPDLAPLILALDRPVWGPNCRAQGWLDADQTEMLHLALSEAPSAREAPRLASGAAAHPIFARLRERQRGGDEAEATERYRDAWRSVRAVCDITHLAALSGDGLLSGFDLESAADGGDFELLSMEALSARLSSAIAETP